MGVAKWIILLFTHPNEFRSLLQFYIHHEQKRDITSMKEHPTSGWDRESMRRCWHFLDLTSRSFAAVIKELEGDLARTVSTSYSGHPQLGCHSDPITEPNNTAPVTYFLIYNLGALAIFFYRLRYTLHLLFAYAACFQICMFYLVLRGLDTIEDDMTIPDEIKQPILRSFHKHTVTPGWKFDGCGPKEKDRQLLVEYDTVVEEVNRLPPQSVISVNLHNNI